MRAIIAFAFDENEINNIDILVYVEFALWENVRVIGRAEATRSSLVLLPGNVADALKDWAFDIPRFTRLDPPDERYLDTRGVAEIALPHLEKAGPECVTVVAAKPHLWRAERVMRKLGFNVVGVGVSVPWDPSSKQWWIRGPIRWWVREIPARILYKLRGWI